MFKRNEYKLLNQMLDDAISGDFRESRFDESELSRLQSKLMRYLSSAAMSERKLQEEKTRIEELITNISHQTKTPLTNIMMYSQLLNHLLVNLIAGKMMMFRYKFVIWPALVCIPVFMAIAAAVPGMVMKQSFQTK